MTYPGAAISKAYDSHRESGGGKDTEDQNTEVNKDSIKCPGLTEPL